MQNPDRNFRNEHKTIQRLILHLLILADYAAGVLLLLAAVRERWNLAGDMWLCSALMTSFAMALLAAIFRSKKKLNTFLPWVFAITGLAAALTTLVLRLNW